VADTTGEKLRRAVTARARGLCEYCRSPEHFTPARYSLEHIHPRRQRADQLGKPSPGVPRLQRLQRRQNYGPRPGNQPPAPLFHCRQHRWQDHFAWSADSLEVVGLTPIGRATIALLRLNRLGLRNLRYALTAIQRHPPMDEAEN
jgi:hypothetical protein